MNADFVSQLTDEILRIRANLRIVTIRVNLRETNRELAAKH
jgi:hypothetical protein